MKFTSTEVLLMFAGYFVFSAVVSGMPSPDKEDGKGYRWVFATLHILAGSIGRLITMLPTGSSSVVISAMKGEIQDQNKIIKDE